MKVQYSIYLNKYEEDFKTLVRLLTPSFDHVSILAKDTKGKTFRASRSSSSVDDFQLSERGYVVRVYKNQSVMEYASNSLGEIKELANHIKARFDEMSTLCDEETWSHLKAQWEDEEACDFLKQSETEIPLTMLDSKKILQELKDCSEEAINQNEHVIESRLMMNLVEVSSLFITSKRIMRQAYAFGEGACVVMVSKEGDMKFNFDSVSGMYGAEMLPSICALMPSTISTALELFDAENIIPGTYDVITTPEVTGLIAHEAFGHGVEMDMFVKNRALAKDYIGKQIASDIVNMCDGAAEVADVSSYFFDDEGSLATKTQIIKDGILVSGICDSLSAYRLGVKTTGNGKRQSFDHKAYTRMTNTYFCPGKDSYEDMVASIKHGYQLEGMQSGMEDPKHWGIQCIVARGREIRDGKFTGKIVAPVILSGYVPDLLKSITMVSTDMELYGGGYCGKGYKEFVKTSNGGPYLKAKARLG